MSKGIGFWIGILLLVTVIPLYINLGILSDWSSQFMPLLTFIGGILLIIKD
ncbi:MAG: hypothetical protein KAI55_00660 [Candidatus Aenigmarchaeota archaeon]|nr:hypothetical protein [Candidatus Aenigmarchaeota archaeon]